MVISEDYSHTAAPITREIARRGFLAGSRFLRYTKGAMLSNLRHAVAADVLDMALVGALIYALLLWFKRTRAAFVAIGLFLLALVYALAYLSGMHMTVGLFQGFFAVFIVAVIVIFQEEIRSAFERLAVWSLTGGVLKSAPTHRQVEILVRSLGDLARDRIGALVVLRGLDPLDRHLSGGWDLNGDLSEALIKSIFDSHSLGHDGALLIEEGRVSRFGVQLPLSKDFAKVTHLGTRHSAALGLSERADALCLAVSEEHGTISTARRGGLKAVDGLEDLQDEIELFFRERLPLQSENVLLRFLSQNWREKLIAAAAAVLLWIFFVGIGRGR
ncbi:MAG: DNA integrity scanning protein DisA nucleotide-binding domain protein [Elusimicrobia bacterium]|nr:DNA integrity scanning protein DisA nucleotide-binding domain protein [Elusimicrobiota bacterium]